MKRQQQTTRARLDHGRKSAPTFAAPKLQKPGHGHGHGDDPTPDPTPTGPDLSAYLVYDSFDRADGPLGNAETGQTWIAWAGDADPELVGGQAFVHGGGAVIDTGSTAQDVRVTIAQYDPSGAGLHFHVDADGIGGMFLVYDVPGAGRSWYAKYVILNTTPGTTEYVTIAGSAIAFTSGDRLRAVVTPTHYAFSHNDTLLAEGDWTLTSDQSYVAATFAGIEDVYSGTLGPIAYDDFSVSTPA